MYDTDAFYITIKEYAERKGVTARAVHKQINNHTEELADHIIFREGKKWLDEKAVSILDDASKKSPVVYVEDAKVAHLKEIEEKYERMKAENEILKEKVIQLQEDKIAYIALQQQQELLLEMKENLSEKVDELTTSLQDTSSELEHVRGKLEESEDQVNYLKNRNLFQRILNK